MAEQRVLHPQIIPLSLDNARFDENFDVEGDFIGVFDGTDSVASVDIKVESRNAQAFTFKRGRKQKTGIHFSRVFVSNVAQAGKILYLIVGGPESFDFDDVGAVNVQSITDPIFSNVLKGAQTQNNQVAVGAVSTLLRTVPANTIEYIELEAFTGVDAFIAFGAAALLTNVRLAIGQIKSYVVSGGAAGLAINSISTGGGAVVTVLAVPIK